jgi:hypothetical protein
MEAAGLGEAIVAEAPTGNDPHTPTISITETTRQQRVFHRVF